MARVLQLRRGTTAENNLFTGAVAEATYDTDRKELRIHDGSTVGGKVVSAPTGAVMAFAGSSAPEGWLVCDGSAISRTTYADLFAVIGTTYGDGDGNTTFNLPPTNVIPLGTSAPVIYGNRVATNTYSINTESLTNFDNKYVGKPASLTYTDGANNTLTLGAGTGGSKNGAPLLADLTNATGSLALTIIKY